LKTGRSNFTAFLELHVYILDMNRNNCYCGKDAVNNSRFSENLFFKNLLFLRERKIKKVREKTSESPLRFIVSAR